MAVTAGAHDVGGVQPAAEPHFEDGDVHAGAAKQLEGHGRRDFEKRRLRLQRPARRRRRPLRDVGDDGGDERVLGDRTAVDDEALGEVDEVGRRVARRSMAGRAQRRIDHRRDRSFAVGAGDVHRAECALGMAEARDDRRDVVEAELDPELFEAEEIGQGVGQACSAEW